ncbi:MAG: biopolymer transporter ExbD [candidate division Zixibacteria bacterium]|nr:biopolymer transporter ExbD [candidate division Zixibacteria bacterium]
MKIKKKRRISIRIDMTPMVDIAFLLLIFYMATTQFKPPEQKEVTLPSSHSQIELPAKDKIVVTVTSEDSIFVDYIQRVEKEVEGRMISTLERIYAETDEYNVGAEINSIRAINPYALVIIKADRNASFGVMQKIMDTMVESNLARFQIITELESERI